MGLFNRTSYAGSNQRQMLEKTIKSSRNNLLLLLSFTIFNLILLVAKTQKYFLFTAFVPYTLVDAGMCYGGMYPPAYYGESLAGMNFLGKGFFYEMLAFAALSLTMYALCWWFSKKKPKFWLTFALVMIIVDTVFQILMLGIGANLLVEYLFRGWIIVSLVTSLSAAKELKNLPVEEDLEAAELEALPTEE